MTIRPATDQDLPVILELSKQSLGEIDGMRTEEYWRWKHLRNPFGVSPVLLALENEKLIGLRAFMQWRFACEDKIITAYRAVDTATHPEYQGKGIFSKLTLSLVEQLKSGAPALIFNTPNIKSMPGYLKMGWKELGKTRLRVRIFPLTILKHRLMRDSVFNEPVPFVFPDDTNELLTEWKRSHSHVVMTDYNLDYLKWRYQLIPVLRYGMKLLRSGNSICMIIYRLKQSGSISELRLAEVVYTGNEQKKLINTAINELAESFKPDVITVLADPDGDLDSLLPFGFIKADERGLTITGRGVNDPALETLVTDYTRWNFSAGTLELF